MNSYCCFICPTKDYSIKSLDSYCPICGNPYGFPLQSYPKNINDFRVIRPLGRGFYSATYLCESGHLNRHYVLKVSPVNLYEFFSKNFEDECKVHKEVSDGSEHIVPINDYFRSNITFGNITIECFIAVLDFVDGVPLNEFLKGTDISAREIAQIAIDLFRIRREFVNKLRYHNDLHEGNIIIQKLRQSSRRAEAIDESIRAVAIDMGSVEDESKSNLARLGDQHWLSHHLNLMVRCLRENFETMSDLDCRIAEALEDISLLLTPKATSQRPPSADECIVIIRDKIDQISSPWKETLKFKNFDDTYNAQTLAPWFVPNLLVDPEQKWLDRIAIPGPLIITGMRGCGKTMLLRALQFHARAASRDGEAVTQIINRLKKDNYVGLFVSCNRLLAKPDEPLTEVKFPLERLFIAYCIEAIRALRHLQDLDRSLITPYHHQIIAEAINDNIELPIETSSITSDRSLEHFLIRIQSTFNNKESEGLLKFHPTQVFEHLSDSFRKCSLIWNSATFFYLLDDVSTRYLKEERISYLISALLFQSPVCAFKITTEAQTLEMAILSPGLIEKARIGRDYEVFDLGAEVYKKTRDRKQNKGKYFIEEVLEQRASYYTNHPKVSPGTILGDCLLEEIASRIKSSSANSHERKEIYYGITALSSVCVGDIGDVIRLYELILKKSSGKRYPVSPQIQSDSYQEFCGDRLYDLNRRESNLKDFAKSFAEAAYELLMHSDPKRLRQYCSIYVRLTTGDTAQQFKKLRELIDAGVFVLDSGTPRTKTRDSDPVLQFKLIYRKIFGLSNFIGLSERDRFELSGQELEKWLTNPSEGKVILQRNINKGDIGFDESDENLDDNKNENESRSSIIPLIQNEIQQTPLFNDINIIGNIFPEDITTEGAFYEKPISKRIVTQEITTKELKQGDIKEIVVGLGFEERTLESVKRLLYYIKPESAILIRYLEKGLSEEIEAYIRKKVPKVEIHDYYDFFKKGIKNISKPALIDVTGLAKPILFHSIRNCLHKFGEVWICHTGAEKYYPLDQDVNTVLNDIKEMDFLESLSNVLSGEEGPYSIISLLKTEADETRRRVLCTFTSPKHERLLSLLDSRDFDHVEIIVPTGQTPRNEVARKTAQIAALNLNASNIHSIDSNDLVKITEFILERYLYWYVERGFNFEINVSGSKLQAVACAVASVVCRISQSWYVSPKSFDINRFTIGVGDSKYFKIYKG